MTAERSAAAPSLVGSWRLRRWEAIGDDGSIAYPFGEEPEGILVYTADGTMLTTIGRGARPALSTADPVSGPVEERLAAAESFVAYSGAYTWDGHDAVHQVEMSLFPNWVGTSQVRHTTLSDDGDTLVLTADPFVLRGRRASQQLTWQRLRR